MRHFIENLRSFNSKERFHLVGHILGNKDFTPSKSFKEGIEKLFCLKIPDEAFAAMDYHIDWLYASLCLTLDNSSDSDIFPNHDHMIKAQQQDIDFIIAFAEESSCHVILIEAKGVTGWTNKQMNSKADRFANIFGSDGKKWLSVQPHFLLLSPERPSRLNVSKWPAWMTVDSQLPWAELPIPTGLRKVTRCTPGGQKDRNGQCWRANFRDNSHRKDSVGKKSPDHARQAGINYRGKLSFSDIVTKCQTEGNNIVVGYQGGERKLRNADPTYIRERLYKWDSLTDSTGTKVWRNWILGDKFIEIIIDKFV